MLANIFLAIAVDKLLEVNEVEKDITKRVEQMEAKRRERQKQLLDLKNPSESSGIGRTLKKIVSLYSASVSHEEEIKRRRAKRKRRPHSEIIRRTSMPAATTTLQERRSSFSRATSDPVNYDGNSFDSYTSTSTTGSSTGIGRLFPRRVSLKNPLRKVEQSIELQPVQTEPRRMYMDKMDSLTSITDDYDEFDWFKTRPSIRTTPEPERSKRYRSDKLVRTTSSTTVSDGRSSPYSMSRNISIESEINTKSTMSSMDSYMSQNSLLPSISSLSLGNSPFPESNKLPDNINSLLRGNSTSKMSSDNSLLPGNMTGSLPGNSPIMKPGATPMIVSTNSDTNDDSITRMVRQSSLEEISPVAFLEEVPEQKEKRSDSKVSE